MYDDREEKIIEFYLCSLRNDFSGFDFDDALEMFCPELEDKLHEHAQCTFEEYQEYMGDFIDNGHGDDVYTPFCMQTAYINFGPEDVKEAIFKGQYEAAQRAFSGMFDHLQEYVDGIDSPPAKLSELITLFDSIIHAQHETGDIFEDMDTEDLKDAAKDMHEASQENDT